MITKRCFLGFLAIVILHDSIPQTPIFVKSKAATLRRRASFGVTG